MADFARLQRDLGYTFKDPQLLELALTHRSMGNRNNERLEFLGDSILNHLIAEEVYRRFPRSREGELSRMRAALVRGDALAGVARELTLGEYLRLGAGERKSGGHRRASILADALESVLGGILLDGGVDECRRCVLIWFEERLQALADGAAAKDPKTALQEYLQGRSLSLPAYELLEVQGEAHDQSFRVACRLSQPELVVEGSGKSRRKAEQVAARQALEKLGSPRVG
ncbi:MAG: ribonuclease III [Halioglobus sp.]|nr:ribonuclease III [Halioglobus sp.]